MSFGASFGYPFKAQNIPKILNIILVFLIIVASLVVVAMLARSSDASAGLMLSAIPVLLAYGLFIGGYTITVIRSVMDGEETLPKTDFMRDLGRGIMVVLAGIVHAIPFVVLYVCMIMFVVAVPSSGAMMNSRGGDNGGMLMLCGSFIVMLFLGFTIGYTFVVGMVRYAAEDSAGALFDIAKNFGTVVSNLGTVFGLFVRQIGMGIVYGILSQVISFAATMMLSGTLNDRSPNILVLMIGMVVIYILVLSLSLMSQLSSAHLFAGFGNDIGIGTMKAKNEYTF